MPDLPESVAGFLRCHRIAVAGVSRGGDQPANAILRRLRDAGHDVFAVNPSASEIDGERCYPDLSAIEPPVEAVMISTHPDVAAAIVGQCVELGIRRVWLHRSFGEGSVSEEAVRACEAAGIEPIVGGCPLMYCEPVDLGHRCMRWWLGRKGRLPG